MLNGEAEEIVESNYNGLSLNSIFIVQSQLAMFTVSPDR